MTPAPTASVNNTEDFWEDLLDFIETGRVIPIVGEGAVTFGPDNSPFYPWLASRLAESLNLAADVLPATPTVNDVVCAWRLANLGPHNTPYQRLNRILTNECPPPGDTLKHLASIDAFNLYLSTTIDPLLARALDDARHGGERLTEVCAFSPAAPDKDLPARRRDLERPLVYHVLGRVSSNPLEFVAWEEDVLEFICALQKHIHPDIMKRLACDLKEHGLLILGLNFSDWLVRFFLRVAKQERLSKACIHTEYLAEGPPEILSQTMVLFFGGVSRNIHVIPCRVPEFAAELARRWRARPPTPLPPPLVPPVSPKAPAGFIFLSYSKNDQAAAEGLRAALTAAGLTVWFDQVGGLEGGDEWKTKIKEAIRTCTLFVPLISESTEARESGFFRLEWDLAVQREPTFYKGRAFIVPVALVNSIPQDTAKVPDVFREKQWITLPNGQATPQILARLRGMLGAER